MPGFPIVVSSSSPVTGAGPSLLIATRWLAKELGFYLPTTVTTEASGGDATRVILADEIRDDEAGYQFLGRPWVYVRSGALAGTQRRVLDHPEAGYQGSQAAVRVSRPLASALSSGVVVEFTSPLPIKSHLGIDGLIDCVNKALELIRVAVRLTVTGNGTYEHDISTYPIYEPWQLVGISDTLNYPGMPPQETPHRPELVVNGVDRTLVTKTAYSASQSFYLDVIVSADRYVYNGSAWGFVAENAAAGLLGDSYQAAAPENWVRQFSMREALDAVITLVEASEDIPDAEKDRRVARLRERYLARVEAARRIKRLQFPRPRARVPESAAVAGPRPTWP